MFTSRLLPAPGQVTSNQNDVGNLQKQLFESGIGNDPHLSVIRSTMGLRPTKKRSTSNVISRSPSQIFTKPVTPAVSAQTRSKSSDINKLPIAPLTSTPNNPEATQVGADDINASMSLKDEINPRASQFFKEPSSIMQGPTETASKPKIASHITTVRSNDPHLPPKPVQGSVKTTDNSTQGTPINGLKMNQTFLNFNGPAETSFHRVDPSKYSRVQSFSSKALRKPLLIMNVDIGNQSQRKMFIFQDTDPWEKAFDFVETNGLPEGMVEDIAELIEANKSKALENMTKKTVRTRQDGDQSSSDLLSQRSPSSNKGGTTTLVSQTPATINSQKSAHFVPTASTQTFRPQVGQYSIFDRSAHPGQSHQAQDHSRAPISSNIGLHGKPPQQPQQVKYSNAPAPQSFGDIILNYKGEFNVGQRNSTGIGGSLVQSNPEPHQTQPALTPTGHQQHQHQFFSEKPASQKHPQQFLDPFQASSIHRPPMAPAQVQVIGHVHTHTTHPLHSHEINPNMYYSKVSDRKIQMDSNVVTPDNPLFLAKPSLSQADEGLLFSVFQAIDFDKRGSIKSYEINLANLSKPLKDILKDLLSALDAEANGFVNIDFSMFCNVVLQSDKLDAIKRLFF